MTDYPIEKIVTHRDDAIGRLTSQYDDATNLRDLVGLFADRYQGLENVSFELLKKRFIDGAEGVQLDELGEIVGEPRLGRSDRVYRSAIRLRVILNSAGGEPESVIRFAREGFGAQTVVFMEIFPAKVEVYVRLDPDSVSTDVFDAAFELSDGNLLELSDGSTLEVSVFDSQVLEAQVDRLREIVAAGIGKIYFTESGTEIAFGSTELRIDETLQLDDGSELELDDGSLLSIFDAATAEFPPQYVAGVGELGTREFELSLNDGAELELDSGDTLAVTDQTDPVEATAPRGSVAELFEVA